MRTIYKSKIMRRNRTLASFIERQDEYKEAKTAYESAYEKLKSEATRVLKLYAPLKNAVSDRNWSNKVIDKLKVKKSGRVIELELHQSGDHVSYWEFPSWMIGANTDTIVEGLNKIIEEDRQRFARKQAVPQNDILTHIDE